MNWTSDYKDRFGPIKGGQNLLNKKVSSKTVKLNVHLLLMLTTNILLENSEINIQKLGTMLFITDFVLNLL